MTVRTDEELSHDDKIQALTDKISENLNVAINELIPHLDEFLKACVTAACCQEHGLAMAAKYLVYSAGKVGQLGNILPNEAQACTPKVTLREMTLAKLKRMKSSKSSTT